MSKLKEPTLINYINRYKMDTELLKKHPDDEFIKKRIKSSEKAIIDYVTSDQFISILNKLNL